MDLVPATTTPQHVIKNVFLEATANVEDTRLGGDRRAVGQVPVVKWHHGVTFVCQQRPKLAKARLVPEDSVHKDNKVQDRNVDCRGARAPPSSHLQRSGS